MLIIEIGNLRTIKGFLREEFLKHDDPDTCVRLSNCIEFMDLLEPNDKGYTIKYEKQIEVNRSKRKIKFNKIIY